MPFNMFPYTDLSDVNLDWLLRKVKELEKKIAGPGDLEKIEKEFDALISLLDAKEIQNRIRQEGVSRIPLDFAAGNTEIWKTSGATVWQYSIYKPRCLLSWTRRNMQIIANMKAKRDLLPPEADPLDPYVITDAHDQYATLLTGLPTFFSTFTIYSAITVMNDTDPPLVLDARYTTEHFTKVASLLDLPASPSDGDCVYVSSEAYYMVYHLGIGWEIEYKPCGVLQVVWPNYKWDHGTPDYKIHSGDLILVNQQDISLATVYGGDVFPRIYKADLDRACAWIKKHRGLYDYNNNGIRRRIEVETPTGGTDCSGIIHQAFRYGAGKFVPDGTKTMISYGKIVAFARAGEDLDLSNIQEGDILGFIYANRDVGSCHHVAIAVRGSEEDPDDQTLRFWHQSTSFCAYTQMLDPLEALDQHVAPEFQQFIHNNEIYGPQPMSRTLYSTNPDAYTKYPRSGSSPTDATYGKTGARIVVRWTEDNAGLRDATSIFDITADFNPGGEEEQDE